MVGKKVIFVLFFILIVSCSINKDKISCDFTEEIILCFINNIDEIGKKIYFEDIGHGYRSYWRIEDDFFEHLRELLTTKLEFNENTFLEKYDNMINIIPKELDNIFSEYPEINENGYKNYINFNIFLNIIIIEEIENINKEKLMYIDLENVNKRNATKIKSAFNKKDIEILDKNRGIIIKKINEI